MKLAIAILLGLTACGPLVQIGGNAPAPESLLTLRAETGPPPAVTGKPIMITLPSAPGVLRTLRIPVTTTSTEIAYLQAASWVEQPNQLFQRVLADVVQAKAGLPVVEERTAGARPTYTLSGRLVECGLDVRSGRVARVRYDAVLMSAAGHMGSRSFEATAPVTAETGPDVARALNVAANDVARQVAVWIAAAS